MTGLFVLQLLGCCGALAATPPLPPPLTALCNVTAAMCVEEKLDRCGANLPPPSPPPRYPICALPIGPFPFRTVTVNECAANCDGLGFKYSGLRASQCLCGNNTDPNATVLPMSNCTGTTAANCSGDASEKCGASHAILVNTQECRPDPTCHLTGTFRSNGSVVSYQEYIDCWTGADMSNMYVNDHFHIQPHFALLCNDSKHGFTKDPNSYWCKEALLDMSNYAVAGAPDTGYHCYEVVLAYQALIDAGFVNASLNTSSLTRFRGLVASGCGSATGHQAKVENHGIDSALQQVYALKTFPDLSVDVKKWMALPEQLYQNWVHGHALDENAINYDGISLVRLLAFLEIMPGTNGTASTDLNSAAFKRFVYEFADSITPGSGVLSNHGGGLQDDGQGFANGCFLYTYFFEVAATKFQTSDPDAAAYFKWAALQFWSNFDPLSDFSSFYWTPVLVAAEERKQLAQSADGRTPIVPRFVDLRSTVVHKNEYGHGGSYPSDPATLSTTAGPVPKKLVVCPSRRQGAPYLQSDVYACPPGYHGSGMQAGTLSHFEVNQTLFIYGGTQTKHTSQSDADTGLPTLMPYSVAAEERFPWRWGQHNMRTDGEWQLSDLSALWLAGAAQESGNWQDFWPVAVDSTASNLVLSCISMQRTPFFVLVDAISLVGPGGAEIAVDDFSYWPTAPEAWGKDSEWSMELDPSAPRSQHANSSGYRSLRLTCHPSKGASVARPAAAGRLSLKFSAAQYTHLRLRFKLEGFEPNASYGFSPQGGGYAAASYLDEGIPFMLMPMRAKPSNDFIANFTMMTAGNKNERQNENRRNNDNSSSSSSGGGHPREVAHTAHTDPVALAIAVSSSRGGDSKNTGHSSRGGDGDSGFPFSFAESDSHGGYNATGYGGWSRDTEWTRHMVLTREGALVVLDSLRPHASRGDWLGGVSWQLNMPGAVGADCHDVAPLGNCTLATMTGPDRDWVQLQGFERTTTWHQRLSGTEPNALSLVAKFGGSVAAGSKRSNLTHGVALGWMAPGSLNDFPRNFPGGNYTPPSRHPSPWFGFPWQTVWSRQRIPGQTRAAFVSVFVPFDPQHHTSSAEVGGHTFTPVAEQASPHSPRNSQPTSYANAIAESVQITASDDAESAIVVLPIPASAQGGQTAMRTVHVTMSVHGEWDVARM